MYGAMPNERFPLPAINLKKIDSKFLRRQVDYRTDERVGTLVVDTKNFYLYLVEENGKAMRYGVGLGRAGFEWAGRAYVARKASWPKWTPPTEMIARQPELEKWSWKNGGMPGGLQNPLGARALYIYQDGRDTLYRLHGTAETWSIGKSVSSGCVRLLNQDIIDLHSRVPSQSPIVVL
ncbi:L,D-transpeptidase [Cohaesibacter celericrescens]|uniref:L,D-transpeptidase n=2 Tax=Cohaesibacter celericrescens TaxID=2067669 RepID=A0A2N5XNN6_9HYPH|nr:L,D-transpeptidase [Cohaesibacter celericrescens]